MRTFLIVAATAIVTATASWICLGAESRDQVFAQCRLAYADHEATTYMTRLCMEAHGYDTPKGANLKTGAVQ